MFINLSELFSKDGKSIIYEVNLNTNNITFNNQEICIKAKESFELKITNLGNKKFSVDGSAKIIAMLPCDRCLQAVEILVDIDISHELDMSLTEEDRIELLDEQIYLKGYKLDVNSMIGSEVCVNLPMKVLCSDNCNGICNRCGTNLNYETCDCNAVELDPRMAVIRDIFKNTQN
jgi:Predicted metal-binding, possibly nucleic acid-binding protein